VVFFIRPEAVQTFLEAVGNGECLLINLLSAIVFFFSWLIPVFIERVKAVLPLFNDVLSFGSGSLSHGRGVRFCAKNTGIGGIFQALLSVKCIFFVIIILASSFKWPSQKKITDRECKNGDKQ
jgi:hypothetical protein